jgi:hypothetical protein
MTNEPLKRSDLGIASFLISIGTFISVICLLVFAVIVSNEKIPGFSKHFGNFAFYSFIFGAPLAHLVGLIMGIIALFQKRRGKGFAVSGIILNLFFPALGVFIIYIMLSALSGFR